MQSGVGGYSPDLLELFDLGVKLLELLVDRHGGCGGGGGHRRDPRGFERKGREEMSDERRSASEGGVWRESREARVFFIAAHTPPREFRQAAVTECAARETDVPSPLPRSDGAWHVARREATCHEILGSAVVSTRRSPAWRGARVRAPSASGSGWNTPVLC